MEETHRARGGEGHRASTLSLGTPVSQHLHMFTSPVPLWTPSFWVIMEASIHRRNWLNCWPLVIGLNFQPLSPSRRCMAGGKTVSSNPLIKRLAPLATSPHLQELSKSHLSNIIKGTSISLTTGNAKGFRSSEPGVYGRPNMYLLWITLSHFSVFYLIYS